MTWGEPEINKNANILIVGRDLGDSTGPVSRLLDTCLSQAGLRRKDVSITHVVNIQPTANKFELHQRGHVERGRAELEDLVQRLRPNVVLTLGNEAAYALVPEWPTRDGTITGAKGIQERRGYFWDGLYGTKVITAVNPSTILRSGGEEAIGASGAIAKMLFTYDIQRAKEQSTTPTLVRPTREVTVIDTPTKGKDATDDLLQSGYAACDIEIHDTERLQCIGFAPHSERAYVFTEPAFKQAFDLLRDRSLKLVFHNGQFDTYFLRTRCNVDVQGYVDDTIVGFHCAWPELAGQGQSRSKRTEKSLRFLASLYTLDAWWKDYETDEAGMYYLNGLDCMVTLDAHHQITQLRQDLQIPDAIYHHELSLVDPVNRILERGILVDRERLDSSVAALSDRQGDLTARLVALAGPLLEERREDVSKPHLFWRKITCPCCRNGKLKRASCWSCAGFDSKPGKKDLAESGKSLRPCEECDGEGQWEAFEFNPNSVDQRKILLYEILNIPKRYEKGRLSVAEDKLKDLLGVI